MIISTGLADFLAHNLWLINYVNIKPIEHSITLKNLPAEESRLDTQFVSFKSKSHPSNPIQKLHIQLLYSVLNPTHSPFSSANLFLLQSAKLRLARRIYCCDKKKKKCVHHKAHRAPFQFKIPTVKGNFIFPRCRYEEFVFLIDIKWVCLCTYLEYT